MLNIKSLTQNFNILVYIKNKDLCFNRIKAFRLNLVNLNVNFLKFTEDLKREILWDLLKLEKFSKLFVKLIIHDHLRTIRLKRLILKV